jgi:hypothetical protein
MHGWEIFSSSYNVITWLSPRTSFAATSPAYHVRTILSREICIAGQVVTSMFKLTLYSTQKISKNSNKKMKQSKNKKDVTIFLHRWNKRISFVGDRSYVIPSQITCGGGWSDDKVCNALYISRYIRSIVRWMSQRAIQWKTLFLFQRTLVNMSSPDEFSTDISRPIRSDFWEMTLVSSEIITSRSNTSSQVSHCEL